MLINPYTFRQLVSLLSIFTQVILCYVERTHRAYLENVQRPYESLLVILSSLLVTMSNSNCDAAVNFASIRFICTYTQQGHRYEVKLEMLQRARGNGYCIWAGSAFS